MNGYYKAELIRGPARQGPWKTIEEVELATLGWVHWHNTQRLHGYLGDLPPAEFEALHAAGRHSIQGCCRSPGRSQARRTRPTASPQRDRGEIDPESRSRASGTPPRPDRQRSCPRTPPGQSNG